MSRHTWRIGSLRLKSQPLPDSRNSASLIQRVKMQSGRSTGE